MNLNAKLYWQSFLLLTLICFVPASSFALGSQRNITPLAQYIHTIYTSRDGLPHNSGRQIVQTSDGYIWIGTQDGLVRFNGAIFQVFDKHNTPELKHNDITALVEGEDSTLWIGTYDGLTSLKHGIFKYHPAETGNVHQIIRALAVDHDGIVWVGVMNAGLQKYQNGKFEFISEEPTLVGKTVHAIAEDRTGNLWVGTDAGVTVYHDRLLKHYNSKSGLPNETVRSLHISSDSSVWFGTNAGLVQWKNDSLKIYTTEQGLSGNRIRTIYEDHSGNLWIGTEGGGICQYVNGTFSSFRSVDGLSGDLVVSILEDHEQNLWVGTYNAGINLFWKGKFLNYTTRDGLPGPIAGSIIQTRNGDVWASCPEPVRFDGEKFNTFSNINVRISQSIVRTSLFEDSRGTIWIGTEIGLLQYRNGQFRTFSARDGLLHTYVRALAEDHQGNLWIGTLNGGVYRYEHGQFVNYRDKGLPMNVIRSILVAHNGDVWIGSNDVVMRWQNGKVKSYTQKEGLPFEPIYDMMEDSSHTVWMGSYGGGLVRFKNDKFTRITQAGGLYNDVVYQILEDDYGFLWMSGMRGISCISKQELNDFMDGKKERVRYFAYTTSDGMVSGDCTGNTQSAGCKTSDGNLWFPTAGGIVVVNPGNLRGNLPQPPVVIERVVMNEKEYLAYNPVSIPVADGQVEFHYGGLSYRIPEKVNFRYLLEGYDREWKSAGTRRAAFYTNLPPGKYIFRVTACNSDGIWNETGASFAFTLEPHFYQTAWFYILAVLIAVGMVMGIMRIRLWQHIQKEKELNKKIEEAMASIKVLGGLIPICSNCKKIRDDKGYWDKLESYIQSHSEAKFSHGICPDCMKQLYPDIQLETDKERQ